MRESQELGAPRESPGPWVAGCDVCQEVCPFNQKAAKTAEPGTPLLSDWEGLLKESEAEYKTRVKNSALNRVKPAHFRRNLAQALGAVAASELKRLEPLIERKLAEESDPGAKTVWSALLPPS
jgi:epoxyqueuosine reductase QueG